MGLDEVKKEIIDDAHRKAEEILVQAKDEADRIFDEMQRKIVEHGDAAKARTDTLIAALERRETAAAEFDARKMMLNAKKSLIDEVMGRAREHIAAWDDCKRADVIKKLAAKAKREIELAVIAANPKDKKHIKEQSFESADIIAGMIGRTKDGRVSVDYSADEMLRSIREEKLSDMGRILF